MAPGALAGDHEYLYDHYNISNGLISDMVLKVMVDSEQHTWFSTYNGLQRFNGYEFQAFTFDSKDPGAPGSNFVEDLYEDRNGDLVVVFNAGVDIYHKKTGRFSRLISDVPYGTERRNEISRRSSVVEDPSGALWVNCNNQVIRIDSARKNFIIRENDFRGSFVINRDSTLLWIITDKALKRYDLDRNMLSILGIKELSAKGNPERLNAIYRDAEGLVWIGTSAGLFLLDEATHLLKAPSDYFPECRLGDTELSGRDITAIYEDYRSHLWIATGKSLFRISRDAGLVEEIRHELDNPNSLLDEQITGIHGNRSGLFWVTYLNEGATRVNIRTNNFRAVRLRPGQTASLGGKTVRSVFKDERNMTWVGLYNNGLDRIHPVTGHVDHFRHSEGDEYELCSNYITSILVDSRERLWVGSHDNGLCYADNAYDSIPLFRKPPFLNTMEEIYHLQEDSLSRIWIGTRTGLGMYEYETDSFQWVLEDHNVQSFLISGTDIWLATWNHGLCLLRFNRGGFRARLPEIDTARSVFAHQGMKTGVQASGGFGEGPRNCISVFRDTRGAIWLGTYESGLVKVVENREGLVYTIYGTTAGAPSNAVYGVTGDERGYIWLSTQQGLGRFDPENETFLNYYREDGLLSNFFMWKAYYRASDGELFFGSADGLNMFCPDEPGIDPVSSRLFISELRIHGNPVEPGDTLNKDVILTGNVAYQDTIILNHRNRDFSLRYYAAGHPNPSKLKYAFKLEGYNEDWIIQESGNRTATFTNLKPGHYRFILRVLDREPLPEARQLVKTVIILPPWWKTRLSFFVYALLIAILVLLIVTSLNKFLRLKHELDYNEKLHQSKLMFFTNISHEFKTPLALIKAPLEEILHDADLSPSIRKNLLLARRNAENLLNQVNELIEFRRTDSGVSKLQVETFDLTAFLKGMASQFEYLADQKGLHFYYQIPEETIRIRADRKKLESIVGNLVQNAINYTGEEGLITLSLLTSMRSFRFKEGYHTLQDKNSRIPATCIGILISDTGVGISKESLPRIFDRFYQIEAEHADQHLGSGIGLALVRNLVKLHEGEIRVASERGKGTEILVLLPLDLQGPEKGFVREYFSIPLEGKPEGKGMVSEANEEGESGPEIHAEPGTCRPVLLIVEDHDDLREYLADQLSGEYRVLKAPNGRKALECIGRTMPELVISDWIMPEMDGAMFIRELRSKERTRAIPVILLTAKSELKERQDALDMGADLVITKPFNMQLLRSQVRNMIGNLQIRKEKYATESLDNLVQVRQGRDAGFIGDLERVIRNNMQDQDLNAAMVAESLGISRTSLYDKIRAMTGMPIGEYIQRVRLKQAEMLMIYKGYSVSEVYSMVGISSSSYFIRLFRKYYGTTPGEYIRNYMKEASN
jgi:signal transduction histidine kinase/ligand-binding sensor domain-containing protein/AraC-like DNA-binding protein